ncbi:MAG: carbohydrate kinase [Bacteroidetes bacterium]|nr:carbohydrate kinase [Bacteroidota bacterium]
MNTISKRIMVGVGEILWDELPTGKQLGGAPANFAYHACQLGNEGIVVSSIGNDQEGFELLSTLKKKAIGNDITSINTHPTGRVTVSTDIDGNPSYTIHEEVAWDYIELSPSHKTLAQSADVICFGTLAQRSPVSRKAIKSFIQQTSDTCIRILDINLRLPYYSLEIIYPLLDLCTILKLNNDELRILANYLHLKGTETTLLKEIKNKFSLDLIILTKGPDGSRLFKSTATDSVHPGYSIQVKDTVGAGDSFTAAVATGLLKGLSLKELHPFSSRVAAYVCMNIGATPKLPELEILFESTATSF